MFWVRWGRGVASDRLASNTGENPSAVAREKVDGNSRSPAAVTGLKRESLPSVLSERRHGNPSVYCTGLASNYIATGGWRVDTAMPIYKCELCVHKRVNTASATGAD